MNETCTDCGAQATCEYDLGMRRGCAAHDPLRPHFAGMARVPSYYRTIPQFPVLATTGHLGIAPPPLTVGINPYPTIGIGPAGSVTAGC